MTLAGEAQEIMVDMAVLGLFGFLFYAMSRGRRDSRLLFWTAGWICVAAHFAIEVWAPMSRQWQNVQACISVDALLLAASCFIYSHALRRLPRRTTRAVAASLIPATLLTVNLAICGWPSVRMLALMILGRQALAIAWFWATRREVQFARSSILQALLIGAWMCASALRGHPEIVVCGLLCEVYLSTALNFYAYGWRSSVAVRATIAGFAAWGAAFVIAYFVGSAWPHFVMDREVWNVPKFFVAVGMILTVIEEDARAARSLGEDYRLLFDGNPEPFWIVEIETLRFVAANEAALNLHGYGREEFLRMKLPDVLPREVWEATRANVRAGQETQHRRVRQLRKDGGSVYLDLRVRDTDFQGKHCRFAMAIDVTEREELQRRLDYQSGHDRLTGLPNRMLLPELLGKTLQRAREAGEKVAVLTLDLDRFKRVNDAYGFRIGDAYLKEIAEMLVARSRSMDIVARTGGDEFTVVLAGLKSAVTAERAVADVVRVFEDPHLIQGYKIETGVSTGVALAPDDGADALTVWRGSESAREAARAAGGGREVWLSAELRDSTEEQVQIETYLRTRMNDGRLHLVYQPIYGHEGVMRGMEALLRLDHPQLGAISPAKLIPIAESAGLAIVLGEWVIEEACRQLLIWKSQGLPLTPVAVNVSGLHIMHEGFACRLLTTLDRYAIDAPLLHIELTESVAMQNVDAVTEQMQELARRGIEFSIDDFGTGHSSLARLGQLPASVLKIDRSFVPPECLEDAHSILQAIITMAHTLGHKVVAEGVENGAQLACLRDLRCDFYQGYLLSRPVGPDKIPALLGSVHPAFEAESLEGEKLHLVERVGA